MKEQIVDLFKNSDDYCMIFSTIFDKRRDLEYIKQVINIIIDNCLYYVLDYEDMLENLLCEIDDERIDEYMDNRYLEILTIFIFSNLMYIRDKNNEEKEVIDNTLNINPENSIRQIVKHQCFDNLNIKADSIDINYLTYLIIDILKNERKKVSEIKYDYGTFSNIYFIGDKVLKIGRRKTFKLEYYKRYIRPIIREQNKIGDENIVFELTEKVDITSVTKRDLDMVVDELNKLGKTWDDSSLDNIGRLIKPNKVYYKYPVYSDNGYIETKDSKIILPAGEIVILDNDHIYEKEKSYIYKK